MATESFQLRSALCRAHPEIVSAMVAKKRPRPETSTFAFLLFEEEDAAMRQLVDLLPQYGWVLVGPIFDAVLAAPGRETVPGTEEALREHWERETGLRLHLKKVRA